MTKKAGIYVPVICICVVLLFVPACGKYKREMQEEDHKVTEEVKDDSKILIAYTEGIEGLAAILEEKTKGTQFVIQKESVYPPDMDEYDIVYLGYEVSDATISDEIRSFLEGYDFSGKTMIPFCIHDGSGNGTSVYDIGNLCPNSKITVGFSIGRSDMEGAQEELERWLWTLDMR